MPTAEATRTATHSNESLHSLGVSTDYSLASELADYEAEQEAEDEKLEREGRREMYAMLEIYG